MQSVTLWVIYVVIFVLVFAAVALAVRGFLGVAWGILIAAVVAMIITAGIAWCTLPGDYWCNHGVTCLGFLSVVLLIIGVILVVVAYVLRRKHKKKLKALECCDEKTIQQELDNHPDCDKNKEKTKNKDVVKEKHMQKSVTNCGPEGCTTRQENLDSLARKSTAAQRTQRSLL